MKKAWRFLSSMQLGIFLLLLLAGVSIIGTVYSDNQQAIQDVYASPWYIVIMLFLAVNLIVCSINRFSSIKNKVFCPKVSAGEKWLKNQENNSALKLSSDDPVTLLQSFFRKRGMRVITDETEEGTVVYADKGRFGHFGSLITHISIIIILIGAAWGSIGKYEDFRLAFPGDVIQLEEQGFSVRIDDFWLEYLDDQNYQVDQYYCDLTILEQGQEISTDTIHVNKPLRYRGVNFYQANFGWGTALELNGDMIEQPLRAGNIYYYKPADMHVKVIEIYPDFTMNYQGMPISRSHFPANPYVLYQLYVSEEIYGDNYNLAKAGDVVEIPLPDGEEVLSLNFTEPVLWTGLQIMSTPGTFVVLAGAILILIGLFLSFYITPRRYWALVMPNNDENDGQAQIIIAGNAYRNRAAFRREFKRLAGSLDQISKES